MTKDPVLRGVIVPPITPFTSDGEVDEAAFAEYLDFLVRHVHGVDIGAVYGSGILMQLEQRMRVTELAVQVSEGRAAVAVFVGAADTDTCVQLAVHAQKAGADAVTCVAPFYYKQVDEALFRHFLAIHEAVDLPVYVYDSPVFSGNPISIPLLQRMASAGITGVITGAASYGIEHIWAVQRQVTNRNFQVISIRDGLALPALMQGAAGFESGVANFFPELVLEFYQSVCEQRYEDAARYQQDMLRLRDVSHGFGRNIPTLHALIGLRGFETGYPRRPFFLLNEDEANNLKKELENLRLGFPFPK